jgi:AraC family transcriptional regulator of adaptative response / DNA-3-methyladenine glycosylase II
MTSRSDRAEGTPPNRSSIDSVSYLTPPRLSSLPEEAGQLEFSSRSMVFPRQGTGLYRAWGPVDDPYVLRIAPAGRRWRISAWGADGPTARAAVRQLFSLDHPLATFYEAVRREPVLRGSDARFAGLRLPRDGSLLESLVHAVIGQQISVAVAMTMERRLVAEARSVKRVDGVEVPFVPGPQALLALTSDQLRRVGLSRAKERSIRAIAQAALDGELDPLSSFQRCPGDEAVARLDELPGVGRWTAENALLRGAGRTDLFLAGDLGIRTALAAYRAVPLSRPEASARRWGDRWYAGWGSYATLYLWRKWITDGTPRPGPRRPAAQRPAGDGSP